MKKPAHLKFVLLAALIVSSLHAVKAEGLELVQRGITPVAASRLRVKGNYAYMVDPNSSGLNMVVADISIATNPVVRSGFATGGQAYDIHVIGNNAYVADGTAGFSVIDVANPSALTRMGGCSLYGNAVSLYVHGNYAYVASETAGLQVVDAGNPFFPTRIGSYPPTSEVRSVFASGELVYISDTSRTYSALKILNISTPGYPLLISTTSTIGEYWNVEVSQNVLYAGAGAGGIRTLNVTDPYNPVQIGGAPAAHGYDGRIFLSNNYAYVAYTNIGVRVFDIANPSNPRQIAQHESIYGARDVAVQGSNVYVVDGSFLRTFELRTQEPEPVKPGSVQFLYPSNSVSETIGSITLGVVRENGSDGAVSANYTTVDGTALAGTHYTAVSGALQWQDGTASTNTITVNINPDAFIQSNLTFYVMLTNITGATTGQTTSVTVTILKDKRPVKVYSYQTGDFNGNGIDDLVVCDKNSYVWYARTVHGPAFAISQWGFSDSVLVPGDYNGNGMSDFAVYDPATFAWYVVSTDGHLIAVEEWGLTDAHPAPGDYTGNGTTDFAVYEERTGYWYIRPVHGTAFAIEQWGFHGVIPVPGDYNGDGATDLAVYDPASGYWYIRPVHGDAFAIEQWGFPGVVPVPGDYTGNGATDLAVYNPASGYWYIRPVHGDAFAIEQWGGFQGAIPLTGDFNGNGADDLAIYDQQTGYWYIRPVHGDAFAIEQWGGTVFTPVCGDKQ